MEETDEIKLTFAEYRALSDFVRLCRDTRDLDTGIHGLTINNRLLVASAVSRLGEALDKTMPGWREESDEA